MTKLVWENPDGKDVLYMPGDSHPTRLVSEPERDTRWEKVFASVGQHRYDIYTNTYEPPLEYCEFRIEVVLDGMIYYVSQIIHRLELEEFNLDLYSFILNEMVHILDDRHLPGTAIKED